MNSTTTDSSARRSTRRRFPPLPLVRPSPVLIAKSSSSTSQAEVRATTRRLQSTGAHSVQEHPPPAIAETFSLSLLAGQVRSLVDLSQRATAQIPGSSYRFVEPSRPNDGSESRHRLTKPSRRGPLRQYPGFRRLGKPARYEDSGSPPGPGPCVRQTVDRCGTRLQ